MSNIAEFNELLRSTHRKGVEDLIGAMETGGFYEAPCSGAHHLSRPGGLVEHSLNVLDAARALNAAWGRPVEDHETLIITCLLHDLGKMGDHYKPNYVENILKSGERSSAKPYTTNTELAYIPHEIRSVMIAERYIMLTEDEEQAILFHNGLYSSFKYEIPGKETPLYMLLHFSDLWVSRVTEVQDGNMENN